MLLGNEEGQRKWMGQWRSIVKKEIMVEEKIQGGITAKEARKDTSGTLRRSRSEI